VELGEQFRELMVDIGIALFDKDCDVEGFRGAGRGFPTSG